MSLFSTNLIFDDKYAESYDDQSFDNDLYADHINHIESDLINMIEEESVPDFTPS